MTIREVFADVYAVLVDLGGSLPMWEGDFLNYHVMKHAPNARTCGDTTEFRFMGRFGMGGKFWVTIESFHVTYYSEDETAERKQIRQLMNEQLVPLHARWRLLVSGEECSAR